MSLVVIITNTCSVVASGMARPPTLRPPPGGKTPAILNYWTALTGCQWGRDERADAILQAQLVWCDGWQKAVHSETLCGNAPLC